MNEAPNEAERIAAEVRRFTESSANTMLRWNDEQAWGVPLVGFSNGADPLYAFYKMDIGAFYLSPLEFLTHQYPNQTFDAHTVTVISWILPQTDSTKSDHRKETHFPSERWARSRIFGEAFNNALRQHMMAFFESQDVEAVAPLLSPRWETKTSLKYGFASTWSERHAAYTSGLGTFGLSDGLITPLGVAMRTGSVVANLFIEPTPKPYDHHHAYCLYYVNGTCGDCIARCPIGAITVDGHDKVLCQKYVGMTRLYVQRHYGFKGYGCGFCQTGVPCESRIPKGIHI